MSFIPLINEKRILQRLRQSDERAFEELYRHYINCTYRKLLYLVKSDDLAEELAQDVFFKIWEKRSSIDPEKSFGSFIFRIAQNLVTDMYRRAALDRKLQDHWIYAVTELYDPIDAHYDEEANRQLLFEAINMLPLQRKKVISLVKIEGKSYQEVSEQLGISTSTIRDHVVKGTKALKAYFAENEIALVLLASAIISDAFTRNIF